MTIGILGRAHQLEAIDAAVADVQAGRPAVLEFVGGAGSGRSRLLDEAARRAEAAGLEVARTVASPARATEPGYVAQELGLGGMSDGVVLVDDAESTDATSIGLLQQAVGVGQAVAVVLARRPVSGHQALPWQRLAEVAERRGTHSRLSLEPLTEADLESAIPDPETASRVIALTGGLDDDVHDLLDAWTESGVLVSDNGRLNADGTLPDTWDGGGMAAGKLESLNRSERRLVDAVTLAGRPIPLAVAGRIVGLTQDDTLELGERLVTSAFIAQSRDGFETADSLSAERFAAAIGDVRHGQVAKELGDAFSEEGWSERDPALIGAYYAEAGDYDRAFPLLATAALAAVDRGAMGEAFPSLDAALEVYESAEFEDPELEGRLRLGRARYYRLAGWSDLAAEDLELAVRRLSGSDRIDAMTFLAAVEDDRQDYQAAERTAAAAEYEAATQNQPLKLGSILGLHARLLARLGFAPETDAAMAKSLGILEAEGSPYQLFLSRYNIARIALDRGRAREAEVGFAGLVADADEIEGIASVADKQAWWARALFMTGRPSEARDVVESAVDNADRSGTSGPVFLSHMAMAEGAYRFGRFEESLAAADDMLGIVLQQLPAWENAARFLRGRALLGLGSLDEASEEADRAYDLCPSGINGWRWRLKCRMLQLQVVVAQDGEWPQQEVEDLTDELLQGQWLDTAAELMALRAGVEEDAELARQGAALAMDIGIPTSAADAINAADLWSDPVAPAVASAMRGVAGRVPDDWQESWKARPEVAAALAAEDVAVEQVDEATEQLRAELAAAFAAAGLADPDTTLSPAQRRQRGLVRRRPVRAGLRWLGVAAAVVVLAGAGTWGVLQATGVLDPPPTPTTVSTQPTTVPTTLPPKEAVELRAPEQAHGGEWLTEGGTQARPNESPYEGLSAEPTGYYWRLQTESPFFTSPVVMGQLVILGGNDRNIYSIDRRTGLPSTLSTGADIGVTATAGIVETGDGTVPLAVIASFDGFVYAIDVRDASRRWRRELAVDGVAAIADITEPFPTPVVYVGARDGRIHVLNAVTGEDVLTYPAAELPALDPITTSVTLAEDKLFFGVDNLLYVVDLASGDMQPCGRIPAQGPITTPVVAEGIVYYGSADTFVHSVEAANCRDGIKIPMGGAVRVKPTVADGVIFVASGRTVLAFNPDNTPFWVGESGGTEFAAPVETGGTISAAPVVADGVLYVPSGDGALYAFDVETRDILWTWQTGGAISSTPAVMNGVIYLASTDGTVTAIGSG